MDPPGDLLLLPGRAGRDVLQAFARILRPQSRRPNTTVAILVRAGRALKRPRYETHCPLPRQSREARAVPRRRIGIHAPASHPERGAGCYAFAAAAPSA